MRFNSLTSPLLLAILSVTWLPFVAEAHLVTTGMGPVYDGIGHLLLTPDDLIPVFALSLYVGLRGPEAGRVALFLLPPAWLAGGLCGLLLENPLTFSPTAFSLMLIGLLVATDLKMPLRAIIATTIAMGLVHGFLNGEALRAGPGFSGLLGIAAALFVLVALVAAFTLALKKPWTRIAVRVAGSWVVAIGVLMLGWMAAKPS